MITNNLSIIITMAGMGMRFREAGYTCPKYMISVGGKTLFEWSMDSLTDYFPHAAKCVFVVRREDAAAEFIKSKCSVYGLVDAYIVQLDEMTDGQATTCMKALPYCEMSAPLMIYNIDTYVEPGELKYSDISGDGYLPCFHAPGDHWSFVRLDKNGRAVEVKEKERISDNCTLGAYYFSSAGLFADLYNEYYSNGPGAQKEKYIAPIYNLMIGRGMKVAISIADEQKVHVLGTPQELKVFENSFV